MHIAINVRFLWWGVYGITRLTDWEYVVISIKTEECIIKKLNTICICTKQYLKWVVEELKDDPDEQSYVEEVQMFLNGNEIAYRYYYDNADREDFYEVLFEAPRMKKV